jgi:chromosome segregation ATPase
VLSLPTGEMLEDDVAQQYIYRLIGGEHFELTSYMLQKGTTQFFTLPALEKRRFIESLSKQNNDLENTKDRVQNRLKELKSRLLTTQTQLDCVLRDRPITPEQVDLLGLELYRESTGLLQLNKGVREYYETLLMGSKAKLSERLEKLSRYNELERQRAELVSNLGVYRENLSSVQDKIQKLNLSELDSLEKKLSLGLQHAEHQKKKSELLTAKKNYEDLVKQEETLISQKLSQLQSEVIEVLEVKVDDVEKKKKEYDDFLRHKQLTSRLPAEVNVEECATRVAAMKDCITLSQQRKRVIGCPHCTKGLIIKGDTIDRASAGPLSPEELQRVKKAVEELPVEEKRLQQLAKQKALREQILSELESIVVREGIEQEYSMLKERYESYVRQKQKNEWVQEEMEKVKSVSAKDKYLSLRKQYEKELEIFKSLPKGEVVEELEELKSRVSELREKKNTRDYLQTEVERLGKMILSSEEAIQHLPVCEALVVSGEEVEELEKKISGIKESETKLLSVKEYGGKRAEYKRWEKRVTQLKGILEMLTQESVSLEIFLRKINEAETKCLEDTIRVVNDKTRVYLQKFFPDEVISLELATEKENKKGNVKTEIAVRLTYKSEECDLSSLSGGEYDRCSLAFLLAVNEVCGSKMLILDESIGSLDMANAENVLEVLKETMGEDKVVILVQHQATCGSYDHVVRV